MILPLIAETVQSSIGRRIWTNTVGSVIVVVGGYHQ